MGNTHLKRIIKSTIRNMLLEQTSDEEKQATPTNSSDQKSSEKESTPRKSKPKRRRKKTAAPPGSIGIAQGAFGSGGRFSKATTEAGARAQGDPQGLMEDLGVKNGGTDLEGILNVMNAAIHSNDIMGQAYSGATVSQEQAPDGTMVGVIGVTNSGLNHRNAIKFLSHTLIGAQNAGLLNLSKAIEINQGRNSPIIVYTL